VKPSQIHRAPKETHGNVVVTCRAAYGRPFPIGGAERWQQIVDNLAALVARLNQSFVMEIEAISGSVPGMVST
jgi:hypothetical protein